MKQVVCLIFALLLLSSCSRPKVAEGFLDESRSKSEVLSARVFLDDCACSFRPPIGFSRITGAVFDELRREALSGASKDFPFDVRGIWADEVNASLIIYSIPGYISDSVDNKMIKRISEEYLSKLPGSLVSTAVMKHKPFVVYHFRVLHCETVYYKMIFTEGLRCFEISIVTPQSKFQSMMDKYSSLLYSVDYLK